MVSGAAMKLLLVSDLHYALKQLDWVQSVAPEFELVALVGDLLDIVSPLPLEAQIVVILNHLTRLKGRARQLVVCSGNHDLDFRDAAGEKVARWMGRVRRSGIPTDGDAVTLDGTLVTVCPWWDGPQARDAIGAQLARDAALPRERWIWLYHAPPEASPTSWAGQRHYGDAGLRDWIVAYRPDLVLCGHIHQAPFRKGGSWVDRIADTWVFNAGRQIGPVPAHVIIDTTAQTACWYSLAGPEEIRLDDPQARPVPLVA